MSTSLAELRTSTVLARLEHETRAHHPSAEADRFSVLDDPTTAGYRRFLATIYRFEHAARAQLVDADLVPLRFLVENVRTGSLGCDLLALGTDAASTAILALPLELPRFRDSQHAFGWLYVLLRNTLQNATVYRALAPRLRSTLRCASRYLTENASHIYERWHELGRYLDRAAPTPADAASIVGAASEAFERQHRWFGDARAPWPREAHTRA